MPKFDKHVHKVLYRFRVETNRCTRHNPRGRLMHNLYTTISMHLIAPGSFFVKSLSTSFTNHNEQMVFLPYSNSDNILLTAHRGNSHDMWGVHIAPATLVTGREQSQQPVVAALVRPTTCRLATAADADAVLHSRPTAAVFSNQHELAAAPAALRVDSCGARRRRTSARTAYCNRRRAESSDQHSTDATSLSDAVGQRRRPSNRRHRQHPFRRVAAVDAAKFKRTDNVAHVSEKREWKHVLKKKSNMVF